MALFLNLFTWRKGKIKEFSDKLLDEPLTQGPESLLSLSTVVITLQAGPSFQKVANRTQSDTHPTRTSANNNTCVNGSLHLLM